MFEFFQPLDVGGFQPTILGFPLVVGGRTDAVRPLDLVDGAARIGLLQNADDLRLGKLRLAHGNLLARVAIMPESSPFGPSQIGGSLQGHIRVKQNDSGIVQLTARQRTGIFANNPADTTDKVKARTVVIGIPTRGCIKKPVTPNFARNHNQSG